MWGWEFLLLPQPPQVFSVRGFEALFSRTGTLGCEVCLVLQLFFLVYPHTDVGPPAPPAASLALVHQLLPCCKFSPPPLPISAPPTSLDECFFFNTLVVGLPYSMIFWQFWLFFVFKFVVVLLVVWGSKAISTYASILQLLFDKNLILIWGTKTKKIQACLSFASKECPQFYTIKW